MRVPDDLAKAPNLKLGVEFKCKHVGSIVASTPVEKLPLTKPSIESFFTGVNQDTIKKEPKRVLKMVEKAFEYYPDEPQLLMGYAYVVAQMDVPDKVLLKKAIEYAKKVVNRKGGRLRGQALMTLAMVYHKDGQLKVAAETIRQAAPQCGSNPEFRKIQAEILKDYDALSKKK